MPKKNMSGKNKKEETKMVDWWKFVAGLVGVVGVVGLNPAEWGMWLIGVAFLAIFVSSFLEK